MHWRHCYPMSRWAAVAILSPVLAQASAFDDREFCLAAQQLSMAAETDVGLWIDRVTRNAGMFVSCDRRMIEFKRFTYASSASMTDAWKERQAAEWNATHCNNMVWSDAIRGGWQIVLNTTAADGGSALVIARCK
jgi:hypothetical protein